MRSKLKLEKSSAKEISVVFKCPFCFLVYADGNLLIEHLNCHDEEIESVDEANQPKSKSFPPCHIRLTRCDHLISKWKGNMSKRSASSDIKASKLNPDHSVPSKTKARYYIKIKSKDGKTLFGCPRPECPKVYRTQVGSYFHYQNHLGIRHKCEYCSYEFTQKSSLNSHIRKIHGTKA